jgi:hypothetical protein
MQDLTQGMAGAAAQREWRSDRAAAYPRSMEPALGRRLFLLAVLLAAAEIAVAGAVLAGNAGLRSYAMFVGLTAFVTALATLVAEDRGRG